MTVRTPTHSRSPQHHCEISLFNSHHITFNIHTLLGNTLTGETCLSTVTSDSRTSRGHFRSRVSETFTGAYTTPHNTHPTSSRTFHMKTPAPLTSSHVVALAPAL